MSHRNLHSFVLLCCVIMLSQSFQSWGWFFSSKETLNSNDNPSDTQWISSNTVAEFSMEPLKNHKGRQLVENAERRIASSNSCWQNGFQKLFAACSEVLADKEKQSRLAWYLTDCFQQDSGRPPLPHCDAKSPMVDCRKKMDDDAHKIFLEFYLETNSICHYLQSDAFKRQTERLVNDLKRTAERTEEKLENIEERADHLLQSSNQIHDSLGSIYLQTEQVAQTSKDVEDSVAAVLKHSEAISGQSIEIAASQSELREGQLKMKETLEEGMTKLHDSYSDLSGEITNLRNEAVEIEKEIGEFRDAMASRMKTLQTKADDIGNLAEVSMDKQKQLLIGQSAALEGLQSLTTFQSQALEESRSTLQQLVEFGQGQQEKLFQRQEQLEQAHDHLLENSRTILEAQEVFESKQASMFLAIDKLFNLQNAILLESRLIKAFFVYSISIFILYMFTSTRQTYNVRPRLYIGLCVTFLIELSVLRYATTDIEQAAWIISLVRSLCVLLVSLQLLYAIFTYRDYEMLNHHMLLALIEKVNGMEKKRELAWDTDSDSEVNWSSWVETELPEDVDKLQDPDFMMTEEVGENSLATTSICRQYNLRNRSHRA